MPIELRKRKALLDVLTSMFSTLEDFRTFLRDHVGKHLDEIAGVGSLDSVRSRVIDKADEQEWLPQLIDALHEVAGPDARAKLDSIGTIEDIRPAPVSDNSDADQHALANRKDVRIRVQKIGAYSLLLGVALAMVLARYHFPGFTWIAEAFPANLPKGLVLFTTFLMAVPVMIAHFFAEDRVDPAHLNRYFLLVVPFVILLPLMLYFFYSIYVIQVDFEGGRGAVAYVIGARMLESCPCMSHKLDIGTCIGNVLTINPAEVTACYDRTETSVRRALLALIYLLMMLSFSALTALTVLKARQQQRARL